MKSALVIGSGGALGSAVCQVFKEASWKLVSVDFASSNNQTLADALLVPHVQLLAGHVSLRQQYENICSRLPKATKFNAIVCVAGGFAMGSVENAGDFLDSSESMLSKNLNSALLASAFVTEHLEQDGVIFLTGAMGALEATPAFIGYGASKAAVHHLTKSLACKGSGLPKNAKAIAILPKILDTPANRAAMPTANFADWTATKELAQKLLEWAVDPSTISGNGVLVTVETTAGKTSYGTA